MWMIKIVYTGGSEDDRDASRDLGDTWFWIPYKPPSPGTWDRIGKWLPVRQANYALNHIERVIRPRLWRTEVEYEADR